MNLDKNQIKKIQGLILYTVIVTAVAIHYRQVLAVIARGFHMALPFLLGAAIAFILNVPMRNIECWLQRGKPGKKWHRPTALILTLILVAGVLALVTFVVLPQLFTTIMGLQKSIPVFVEHMIVELEGLFITYPDVVEYLNSIVIDWNSVFDSMIGFLKNGAGSVFSATFSAAVSIVSGFTSFGIGFVFSIYILLQKENLCRQFVKLLKAFLPKVVAKRTLEIAAMTERIFSNFLAGQCVEAVILGTMFFIAMTILDMPYALLIGVLIAFTALIPIFGAFIGCAVGVFLMLMLNPMTALAFFILFNVLQQIEGNLIYPHVVGGSVGLPSIWVLMAVTIGGSLMGVVGMLVFIPLCSVLYTLLKEEVNRRLSVK